MRTFLVGFFIVLFLSGISLAIISCVTDGGTGYLTKSAIAATESPGKRWVRLQVLVRFALYIDVFF